jgi:hypothetical protein
MIKFDESEHLHSDLSDLTLQFIADMYGPEVRDRLLFPVVEHVEPNPVSML